MVFPGLPARRGSQGLRAGRKRQHRARAARPPATLPVRGRTQSPCRPNSCYVALVSRATRRPPRLNRASPCGECGRGWGDEMVVLLAVVVIGGLVLVARRNR